ncbi:hypothetical protein RJT34_22428 [Clitoria ternatea]|uniref:Bromo domain-containing protein n=1 Tax=Clitoria ternatea TaxID=43366 RepID=A0AAN9IVD6_CLITE
MHPLCQAMHNEQVEAKKHSSPHEGDDQPSKMPSSTLLPEKRKLQLVLDTLQRRDIYEIFAEPVDPDEVEDYYEIIKEPMDFGTMRAKLHEGMYKTIEQFEHDVFLIFDNAMHFNSSGTIYFRQARAINELAKKVVDQLKTNPEEFESEFSETRRKVSRRNQGDFRDSMDMKSSEITIGMHSKTLPCSSRGASNQKSFRKNHGCSDIAKHADVRDFEIPTTSTKDSSRCGSVDVDGRFTLNENESVFSTVNGQLKLLEHVNQQEMGYKDSLMQFVKDLGPTAQNIARRKLLGGYPCSSSRIGRCEINNCEQFESRPWAWAMETVPSTSSCVFNLPYLKTRLHHIINSKSPLSAHPQDLHWHG